jgi:hypothetical protein
MHSYELVDPRSPVLLTGTSPGMRQVHDPEQLPFDTVTYLLRAESARARLANARGFYFVVDTRLDGDTTDAPIIAARTERLRTLVAALVPQFSFVTHGDLEADGLSETLAATDPHLHIPEPDRRHYARIQTAQVMHLRKQAQAQGAVSFTKFGWILSQRASGPAGGEVHFDQSLPASAEIRTEYTAPGFLLSRSDGKAPYLLARSDEPDRLCLPHTYADIDRELAKIRPGISRLMVETLRATALAILEDDFDIHDSAVELVQLPVLKHLRQPVNVLPELADLRARLEAAFSRLLS